METTALTPNDYIEILKLRKWDLILPALIIILIAVIVAFALPPIYKSTSTILIEEQEIPADFVVATVTGYAEQRLETINQRIMSHTRLLEIINQFNLYQDLRDKWTTEEIVEKMRKSIFLEPISAEIVDPRTGKPTTATIAFTLSYDGKNPDTVQKVAGRLTSLFLQENIQARERQTLEATRFLEDEMNKVKINLAAIEARISEFKKNNINELPELLQVNMQSLHNIETGIERANEQLRNLKEREGYLTTQLAGIPTESVEDKKRLDELKMQLVYLKTRFSDEYPDIIKTKAEINELENQMKKSSESNESENNLPDNPAYLTLSSQLTGTLSEIESVKRQIKDLDISRQTYRARIEATPKVEEQYNALINEQKNTQAKYDDLMRKHMEAKVAQGLEKEQKGERFTLIEPARLPEKPYKPNRLAIFLIGIVLGIGGGVGFAAIREYSDQSVKNAAGLIMATSLPVLATIPEIKTEQDLLSKKKKKIGLLIGIVLVIIIGLSAFHFLVMDLNVFWAKLIRKMAI